MVYRPIGNSIPKLYLIAILYCYHIDHLLVLELMITVDTLTDMWYVPYDTL